MPNLVQGDYVAIGQLDGNFSDSHDFALLPVAESDCDARSGQIVRKQFDVRVYVKCGTRVQQPCMCVLCIESSGERISQDLESTTLIWLPLGKRFESDRPVFFLNRRSFSFLFIDKQSGIL